VLFFNSPNIFEKILKNFFQGPSLIEDFSPPKRVQSNDKKTNCANISTTFLNIIFTIFAILLTYKPLRNHYFAPKHYHYYDSPSQLSFLLQKAPYKTSSHNILYI